MKILSKECTSRIIYFENKYKEFSWLIKIFVFVWYIKEKSNVSMYIFFFNYHRWLNSIHIDLWHNYHKQEYSLNDIFHCLNLDQLLCISIINCHLRRWRNNLFQEIFEAFDFYDLVNCEYYKLVNEFYRSKDHSNKNKTIFWLFTRIFLVWYQNLIIQFYVD